MEKTFENECLSNNSKMLSQKTWLFFYKDNQVLVKNIKSVGLYGLHIYNRVILKKSRLRSPFSARSIRRNLGFPVRGQRTCSNSKTSKKRLWLKKKN